ncbi:p-loop containing nucleoside triphosphate hydrolase [Venustampulla echinocandica]|uniref:p-loop containing nucleoside triphosphate hydrolase n=1 Tax=Venustampulla echinocandica TaxID=2656787 RepID=A0A370U389_9HELO|nr:p-loop containing nucleoside triphosphate hydrolase [Venustampulla echinocandica]RDL42237.1 p-loop containing nucleoside triphosphate hydrolase [Venustampulla echinocandica]
MFSNDDFVHISTSPGPQPKSGWGVGGKFFDSCKGQRWFTEAVIVDAISLSFPRHHLTVSPSDSCDLLAFADARDDAHYSLLDEDSLVERKFQLPLRRYNDQIGGSFGEKVVLGKFDYEFQGNEFLLYVVEGSDGLVAKTRNNYILVAPEQEGKYMTPEEKASAQKKTDELIAACSRWMEELHSEVLVFDQGFWQKNTELWQNIQKSAWDDVILEKDKKDAIIDDVLGFFDGEERYTEFGVPWKRGVIFHGPPGNGKTISTKALMHDISKRKNPKVESLYVKSFNSYAGPEFGIRQIFLKARQMAPCILIFEDIDSLVNVAVRSYFLNEVDGLESNHGILMIGSTNHIERLDPGIAKRPSRFDRKYFFDVPNRDERVQYSEYWRHKLRNNDKVDFPKEMCTRVADITGDFSFAYMKEAFVAALQVLAGRQDEKRKCRSRESDLRDNALWIELKKQIEALRKEINGEAESTSPSTTSQVVADNEYPDLNMESDLWPVMSRNELRMQIEALRKEIGRDTENRTGSGFRPVRSDALDGSDAMGTYPIHIRNPVMPRYM